MSRARRGSLGLSWPPCSEPRGLVAESRRFLAALEALAYSAHTVRNRERALRLFACWCHEQDLTWPEQLSRAVLERYQRHLHHYRRGGGGKAGAAGAEGSAEVGKPLTLGTQYARLEGLKALFRWLVRQGRLSSNPAADLQMPRLDLRLPARVLSAQEVELLLSQPDTARPLGLRDRAILETLYSTGMRRSELVHLELGDLELERAVVLIRLGKGRKDRVVPLGRRASAWVQKYLAEARCSLLPPASESKVLFLSYLGLALVPDYLSSLVRSYVQQAGLGPDGACHMLRHSMATLMLENGADIRFIQEMLGHARLESTKLYTRVSIRALQQVHAATHPAELGPTAAMLRAEDGVDEQQPGEPGPGPLPL